MRGESEVTQILKQELEALETNSSFFLDKTAKEKRAFAITALRAALVAAAERERRAFEIAECYRCGWDSGAKAEREKIARQWDALHNKYMADPLRRQMMLSYEMVANLIRGKE